MRYINMKGSEGIETVDEFETYKEAKRMLVEYQTSDRYNEYYISRRSTREWKERT